MAERESRPEASRIREVSGSDSRLPFAWQPFTFRGIAAFSNAPIGRLLLVQLLVSLGVACTILWFLKTAWFPSALEAIRSLPPTGQIENKVLATPRHSPEPLAASSFVAFSVNLDRLASLGSASDLRIEFHRTDFDVCSLFGCLTIEYPTGYLVQFNQPELEAWWGAWRTTVLAGVAGATIVFLFASWFLLAAGYLLPVWFVAYFKDRKLSMAGSWKLASAGLLAPATGVAVAIVLYGLNAIDLLRLLILWAVHIPAGWVLLHFAIRRLPAVNTPARTSANPFGSDSPKAVQSNPFTAVDPGKAEPEKQPLP